MTSGAERWSDEAEQAGRFAERYAALALRLRRTEDRAGDDRLEHRQLVAVLRERLGGGDRGLGGVAGDFCVDRLARQNLLGFLGAVRRRGGGAEHHRGAA